MDRTQKSLIAKVTLRRSRLFALASAGNWRALSVLAFVGVVLFGCRSWDIDSARRLAKIASITHPASVTVKKKQRSYAPHVQLLTKGTPKPTPRVMQYLRRFDLEKTYSRDPDECLEAILQLSQAEPSLESVHVLAELAYLQGDAARLMGNDDRASHMLATSLVHAYRYLFDPALPDMRNAYDPEFRRACDLYNLSLEGLLRIINKDGGLKPNATHTIDTCGTPIEFTVRIDGRWEPDDLSRFEFVSDYQTKGLKNQYSTYGLGVPMIGVRETTQTPRPWDQFYPPGLAFSVTAFLEICASGSPSDDQNRHRCELHLYDPLQKTSIQVGTRFAPLESDMTTPLAYFLNDPLLNTDILPTFSLLNAELIESFTGLYMLEPYDPQKIPVVLVHGLWSTPVTWTEMYNDLRSMEEIRANYQFWFYLYPTGQPFWVSAQQMREDLAHAYKTLDPWNESQALHNMVLIGHSMGGLVSALQTIESGDNFWRMVSDKPFDELQGDRRSLDELRKLFFFSANPSIKRVITIGTPHQGSSYANSTTQWLGRKLFQVPDLLETESEKIVRENSEAIRNAEFFATKTSIDSLSPKSDFFETMKTAQRPAWVHFHNIVGHVEDTSWVSRALGQDEAGDGVVSLASATSIDVQSEIEVNAEHADIHRHPLTILEVRRVMLEHLREYKQ